MERSGAERPLSVTIVSGPVAGNRRLCRGPAAIKTPDREHRHPQPDLLDAPLRAERPTGADELDRKAFSARRLAWAGISSRIRSAQRG